MPIHPSSAGDVPRLLKELGSREPFRRETAVARLAVAGPRAVAGLIALAESDEPPTHARAGALAALESIGDPRATAACMSLSTGADDELATGAIGVLGTIARGDGPRAMRAFEHLAALAVDRAAATGRRLAALTALEGFPERLLRPLYSALAADPASRLVARVTRRQSGVLVPLEDLVEGALPDDPSVVGAIVREDASGTRVAVLRKLVDALRRRERRSAGADREQWLAVRGQVHQELGARGSRIALYDLRETLEEIRTPLPVGFLAAAAAVGDAACLEPLASAWVSSDGDDRWYRAHVVEAVHAIARREGITRRHRTVTRILSKWPTAGPLVAVVPK